MNIFITGGSGFIGKHLKDHLASSYCVYAPSHSMLELLDEKAVRQYVLQHKIDVIIHSAIIGGSKKDVGLKDITKLNLRMFFNIVRNSHLVRKILYLGSGLEYDKSRSMRQIVEEQFDRSVPTDDYGLYKYIAAKYIELSHNIYDLVIFGIFGKYEDYLYKFISNAIVKNLLGKPIVIAQNVFFDFLFVDDLCCITEFFLQQTPRYKRYNIVTGKRVDLVSVAKMINTVSDHPSEIKILTKGLKNEYSASNKRLITEMKNIEFTDCQAAIEKLYNWYKKNIQRIDKMQVTNDPFLAFITKQGTLYKSQ